MNTLRLTLKKNWFDMILRGEKKEEYREYKDYWKKRLVVPGTHPPTFKKFDAIEFINGYSKDAPRFTIECNSILATFGKEKWGGDPNNRQFVFKLGEIIKTDKGTEP